VIRSLLLLFLVAPFLCCLHAATVSLAASTTTPVVGDTFSITLSLADAPVRTAWHQVVTFDPARVELTAAGQATGMITTFVPDSRDLTAINASGQVRTGGYVLNGSQSGSGTLAVLTFRAKAVGTTHLGTTGRTVVQPFGNLLIGPPPTNIYTVPASGADLVIVVGIGAPSAPSFSVHPGDRSVTLGLTASFTASAGGSPLPTLRWQRSNDLGVTWADIAGATTASYTTPVVVASDDGARFRCVASNSLGSATSNPARLTVAATRPGDLNGDGRVTFEDLSLFLSSYGKSVGQPGFLTGANLRTTGSSANTVDFDDLVAFLALY
jgi:large repetitive protein